MSRNNDYTTENLLYSLIYIIKNIINSFAYIYRDKKHANIPQQIYFTGKLEEDYGATMLFIAEKQQKTVLDFSLDALILREQCNHGVKFTE